MSVNITTAFVEQYSANVQLLSQQKQHRFEGAVRVEPVTGDRAYFEQIGQVEARVRPSRHADTPRMDVPHARRACTLADYDWADLIDKEDKVRMLIDPTSSYAQSAAMAMNRAKDDVLIAAATGTAYTGHTGTTAVALPSSQKIVHGSAGLTIAKLRSAKEVLDANDVDEDMPRYIMAAAQQFTNLLATTEITSSDYNTVKALVRGEIDTFLGFQFRRSQRLGTDTDGNRQVIAWCMDGLLLGVGSNPVGRISERDDKNYATQVFYSMCIGATRMEEDKVVEIACVEV